MPALSVQAQAFEARKNWIARLVRAKVCGLTCNLGPATHPLDLPSGNRSYGWLRAHLDEEQVPGLPGAPIPTPGASFADHVRRRRG